jgi:aspartate kinase
LTQVYKFGGSTIRSADALRSIADIILNSNELLVVVLSATYNTTNELEEIGQASARSVNYAQDLIETLFEKHYKLCRDLNIVDQTNNFLANLKDEVQEIVAKVQLTGGLTKELMDSLYSIGERASSFILYSYLITKQSSLNFEFLDARDVVITNNDYSQACPLFFEVGQKSAAYKKDKVYITQGFIGRDLSGKTTTLGREGSDYTAAILSWAFDVESLVVWKDVEGIYQCDPKVFSDVKVLEKLSYSEAELLTQKGAKVLFPRTMAPLREKSIKLIVKSTFKPEGLGTTISEIAHNGHIGITVRIENDKSIVSLLGKNLFSQLDHNNVLKRLMESAVEYQVYEHSQSTFAVAIPHGQKNIAVPLFAEACLS